MLLKGYVTAVDWLHFLFSEKMFHIICGKDVFNIWGITCFISSAINDLIQKLENAHMFDSSRYSLIPYLNKVFVHRDLQTA